MDIRSVGNAGVTAFHIRGAEGHGLLGTHNYAKFIKPSELARMAREAGLGLKELIGMTYNPITKIYALEPDSDVNYIMAFHA